MIANDKKLHVLASLAITLALWQLIDWWAVPAALVIGIAKEVYDLRRTGFDMKDLLADSVGILVGAVFELIVSML